MAERISLNRHPDLRNLQGYVEKAIKRNGLEAQDLTDASLLLTEQVGGLAKAVRTETVLAVHAGSKVPTIEDGLAGVLFSVVNLANLSGVDLETAFRNREKRFRRRKNRDG